MAPAASFTQPLQPTVGSIIKDHCGQHYHRHHHHIHHDDDDDDSDLLPLLLALSRISSELSPPMLLHWLEMMMMIYDARIVMVIILELRLFCSLISENEFTSKHLLLVDSVQSEDSVTGPKSDQYLCFTIFMFQILPGSIIHSSS